MRSLSSEDMNGLRWRPIIGLGVIACLAPFATHPLDWLLAVEIGLSILILVGMVEFILRIRTYSRMAIQDRPDLAVYPALVPLIAISTLLWAIGGTSAVVESFAHHDRALHAASIFGLLAQPVTLAWLMLFIRTLQREEDRQGSQKHNRRAGDRQQGDREE